MTAVVLGDRPQSAVGIMAAVLTVNIAATTSCSCRSTGSSPRPGSWSRDRRRGRAWCERAADPARRADAMAAAGGSGVAGSRARRAHRAGAAGPALPVPILAGALVDTRGAEGGRVIQSGSGSAALGRAPRHAGRLTASMPRVVGRHARYNVEAFVGEAIAAGWRSLPRLRALPAIDERPRPTRRSRAVADFETHARIRLIRTEHAGLVAAGTPRRSRARDRPEYIGAWTATAPPAARTAGAGSGRPRSLSTGHGRCRRMDPGVRFAGSMHGVAHRAGGHYRRSSPRRQERPPVSQPGATAARRRGRGRIPGRPVFLGSDLGPVDPGPAARHDLRAVPEYLALLRSRHGSLYWSSRRLDVKRSNLSTQLVALRHLGTDPVSLLAPLKSAAMVPVVALLDRLLSSPGPPTAGSYRRRRACPWW